MSFRDNLLHLRAVHNLTQEQLAEQLGVSRQSVTKWEADKSYPEMDKLIALCQIFDCTLDELVQGDLTDKKPPEQPASEMIYELTVDSETETHEEDTNSSSEELVCVPDSDDRPIDEFGYDAHMRRFADRISTGVMMIILGTAISMVFYGLPVLPENIATALGVLCTLIGAVLGVAAIVPASLDHATFVRQHPHLKDFYTEEDKARAQKNFAYELIGGLVLIFIGIVVIIVFSETPLESIIGLPLMLALIAVGVKSIIHGSMVLGMTSISNYNQGAAEVLQAEDIEHASLTPEQKEEYLKRHTSDKRTGGICGAIMIIATIAGLVMLFVPEYQSPLFWLVWPIGGLLCGLVSTLMKAFAKD